MRPGRSGFCTAGPSTQRSALRRATQITMALTGFPALLGGLAPGTHALHTGHALCPSAAAIGNDSLREAGQHLSLRADVLPPDAQRAWLAWAHVAPFSSEPGCPGRVEALGASQQGLRTLRRAAAASIAQIHRRHCPTGRAW